ncbi:MAG TPA: hypothetical protein VL523_19965 [Terriglobia bacterium]|nr:hypothetical protein [Terriglobia bacterium]
MTIVIGAEQRVRRIAPRLGKAGLARLARLALTAALWAVCAWLGAVCLQALEAAVSR